MELWKVVKCYFVPLPRLPIHFKKQTLAQVFSCEFCEISKNTFSYRTPPVAVSEYAMNHWNLPEYFCK